MTKKEPRGKEAPKPTSLGSGAAESHPGPVQSLSLGSPFDPLISKLLWKAGDQSCPRELMIWLGHSSVGVVLTAKVSMSVERS